MGLHATTVLLIYIERPVWSILWMAPKYFSFLCLIYITVTVSKYITWIMRWVKDMYHSCISQSTYSLTDSNLHIGWMAYEFWVLWTCHVKATFCHKSFLRIKKQCSACPQINHVLLLYGPFCSFDKFMVTMPPHVNTLYILNFFSFFSPFFFNSFDFLTSIF